MDPMSAGTVFSGISATNAGYNLLKVIKERLKSGDVKPDEIAGRIGELYDYIGEAKDSLVNAKEEINNLKDRIRVLESQSKQRGEMKFADFAYWTKDDGPFCQLCWDNEDRQVRLQTSDRPLSIYDGPLPEDMSYYFCLNGHSALAKFVMNRNRATARKKFVEDGLLSFE